MLKISKEHIAGLERDYPGIAETILRFDRAELPPCPYCGSLNTAEVQVGVIGRTILIAGATTKVHLIPNGPRLGAHFCNDCDAFFG